MTHQTPPTANFDMIVFSHLRWEFVKQRPQHLLERFGQDRKILFVEEPMTPNGYPAGYSRLKHVTEKITVLQIWSHGLNVELYSEKIKDVCQKLAINAQVVWFYSPSFIDLLNVIPHQVVVYDCMDELTQFKGAPTLLKNQEQELLLAADLVFTGGRSLYESKSKQHTNVHCFPSSVEEEHFTKAIDKTLEIPADIKNIRWPIVGFYGVIDERMDLELLAKSAKALSTASFVIIGPTAKIEQADLPIAPNIHYLGMKSYEQLPSYLQCFDVAFMPFALNEATEFISPTKTLEFMAAQKPVISTAIKDVQLDYSHLVPIVSNASEAKKAILSFLNETLEHKELRIAHQKEILAKTSWDKTANGMKGLIEKKLRKNSQMHSTQSYTYLSANM